MRVCDALWDPVPWHTSTMETPQGAPESLAGVCQEVAAAFSSSSVAEELAPQLRSMVAGALHLSLHVVDREDEVVLASGNLLSPGLLTSSLHPLSESLISASAIGAGPKLWKLDGKRTVIPREIASITRTTGSNAFLTVPLPQSATDSDSPAFGFLLAAFPSQEALAHTVVSSCLSLSAALSQHSQQQLQQHCRLVASCLLLANHHNTGAERGAQLAASASDAQFSEEGWEGGWDDDEDDEDDGNLSDPGASEAEGVGGYGRTSSGGGQRGGGRGGRGGVVELKMDPLSLTFEVPEAERAFQLYYGANMLRSDMLAFLVHALLLCIGYLSPWTAAHLTTKQCCQGLAVVLPLPVLLLPATRHWYCRHRDTLLWLLLLYTLCYMHIRMGQFWGGAPAAAGLPKLPYVYGWLALSSVTWQLRFSHHLPVTVLAHAVNIALLWQSSCPAVAAGHAALECGLLGVLVGSLYLAPAALVVYCVERRARRLFAAFLPVRV